MPNKTIAINDMMSFADHSAKFQLITNEIAVITILSAKYTNNSHHILLNPFNS